MPLPRGTESKLGRSNARTTSQDAEITLNTSGNFSVTGKGFPPGSTRYVVRTEQLAREYSVTLAALSPKKLPEGSA